MPAEPIKFLLVDDIEANLVALQGLLRRDGLELLTARSGAAALELLLQHEISLAIVDVQMPEMNGFELAELMRGAERTRAVPIIFLTAGEVEKSRPFRGYEAGAVDFLYKPIEPQVLRSKANVFFELASQRQELARLLEERTASDQRFQLAARATNDAIWDWDMATNALWWNDGVKTLFGYTDAQVQNDLDWWNDHVHPEDRGRVTGGLHQLIESNETFWRDEYRFRRVDGSYADVFDRGYVIRDPQGRAMRMIGAMQDLTERKRAQAALAQARHELQQHAEKLEQIVDERTAKLREAVAEMEHFSYTITHDMRAPLRAMRAFGDILNQEYSSTLDERGRDYLRRITQAAVRMDSLILDALNYSKAVRAELPLHVIDPGPLLHGMVESYPQFHRPKAEIDIAPEMPEVLGNQAALTQCFSNLLSNAVKFVEPGRTPQVRVWAERRDGFVRLWFEDNGIGIPADQHERVFTMFQRLDKRFEGTGVGLALVRKVVQRMKGSVGVESTLGHGSRFWIELAAASHQ